MKTRVAFVIPYFGTGGAENMVAHLVSNLDRERIYPEVFCIYGEPQENCLEREIADAGIKIHYVGKSLGFSARAVFKLGKLLSGFHPDIVHTHLAACMYSAPWVIFHKVKMIHTLHSTPEFENRIFIRKIITTILFKTKKAIPVALSGENQELTASYYKLNIDSVEMVYNPVIVKRYYHRENTERKQTFITVGRLSPEKNQIMLIMAFEMALKKGMDASLSIVGDGPDRDMLESYVKEHDISDKVNFVGYVDNVQDYLADADAFLLSSKVEGIPLSILEAMASGLPVIATDVGGCKDIVTDNGILVEPGNLNAFTDAVLRIYENQDLRTQLGKNSRVNVLPFDVAKTAEAYMELYKKYA